MLIYGACSLEAVLALVQLFEVGGFEEFAKKNTSTKVRPNTRVDARQGYTVYCIKKKKKKKGWFWFN